MNPQMKTSGVRIKTSGVQIQKLIRVPKMLSTRKPSNTLTTGGQTPGEPKTSWCSWQLLGNLVCPLVRQEDTHGVGLWLSTFRTGQRPHREAVVDLPHGRGTCADGSVDRSVDSSGPRPTEEVHTSTSPSET